MRSARYIERRIAQLQREIGEIDQAFYDVPEKNRRDLLAGMLERKRDDIVRSAVLQIHTAIEDLLTLHLACALLKTTIQKRGMKFRTVPGKAVHKILFDRDSLGFDMKLELAVALFVISAPQRELLRELNTLRNRCSHNWLLKVPVRRRRRPGQKKRPLLSFRGQDLHKVEILKQFMSVYGPLYAKLWLRYVTNADEEEAQSREETAKVVSLKKRARW
jgi:hypothetical protein